MLLAERRDPVLKAIERESKASSRRPSQANYRVAMRTVMEHLAKLVDQLAGGEINAATFERDALQAIEDGHITAGVLGRQKAGDFSPRSVGDMIWALPAMRDDRPRFQAFVQSIRDKDPRYVDGDGSLLAKPIKQRSSMYVGKMRGTANRTFTAVSPDDVLIDWVMLNSEHCDVCPELQSGSPYTKRTLPSHPGDGSTPCRINCGCVLVTYSPNGSYDPQIGFARVFDPSPQIDLPDLTAPPDTEGEFLAF